MNRNESGKFLEKKGFEIAYIFMRIADSLKNRELAERLTSHSLSLLENAANPDGGNAGLLKEVKILNYLTRLGADMNLIHRPSSEVICGELQKMESAAKEMGPEMLPGESELRDAAKLGDRVQGMGLNGEIKKKNSANQSFKQIAAKPIYKEYGNAAIRQTENRQFNQQSESANGIAQEMRQSAILNRIRQFSSLPDGKAGCRMKDIQDAFPDISERTLRYDLGKLMEKGQIERLGVGGPATSYRTLEPRSIELPAKL